MVTLGVKVWAEKLKDTDAIPAPEMSQFRQWMEKAWASITDDELRSAMQKAIGMKLSSSSR